MVQIDLKEVQHLRDPGVALPFQRVYHDVVVQVADDADFIENVRTLYSNDRDNSSSWAWAEKGVLGDVRGTPDRRQGCPRRARPALQQGQLADDQNHYIETEVYGLPANNRDRGNQGSRDRGDARPYRLVAADPR